MQYAMPVAQFIYVPYVVDWFIFLNSQGYVSVSLFFTGPIVGCSLCPACVHIFSPFCFLDQCVILLFTAFVCDVCFALSLCLVQSWSNFLTYFSLTFPALAVYEFVGVLFSLYSYMFDIFFCLTLPSLLLSNHPILSFLLPRESHQPGLIAQYNLYNYTCKVSIEWRYITHRVCDRQLAP